MQSAEPRAPAESAADRERLTLSMRLAFSMQGFVAAAMAVLVGVYMGKFYVDVVLLPAGLFAIAIVGATVSVIFFDEIEAKNVMTAGLRFGTLPDLGDPYRSAIEEAFVAAYGVAMGLAAACSLLAALVALLFLKPRATAPV